MKEVSLTPLKILYLSFPVIDIFTSYKLPDSEYGGTLIFYGITPGFYFNFFYEECGQCIPEVIERAKGKERDLFSVVNNILRSTTDFRLQTNPHLGNRRGYSFILREYVNETKVMSLELLNLDIYWSLLNREDKKRIIRRSKRR
jgi:hypothetical protein